MIKQCGLRGATTYLRLLLVSLIQHKQCLWLPPGSLTKQSSKTLKLSKRQVYLNVLHIIHVKSFSGSCFKYVLNLALFLFPKLLTNKLNSFWDWCFAIVILFCTCKLSQNSGFFWCWDLRYVFLNQITLVRMKILSLTQVLNLQHWTQRGNYGYTLKNCF